MRELLILRKMDACNEAIKWLKTQPDFETAWQKCKRGDWMLWLLGKLSGSSRTKSRKQLVWTACQCARLSLKYIPEGELRPLKAIETAEAWTKGKATLQEVKDAAYAAYAADDDAYAAVNAAYAAYDAAYTAYAAVNAAFAAVNAAYAAFAAAYAADDDAYAAYPAANIARSETLRQCADIVRKYYPKGPKF